VKGFLSPWWKCFRP